MNTHSEDVKTHNLTDTSGPPGRADIVSVSKMIRHDISDVPWATMDRFPLAVLLDDGVPRAGVTTSKLTNVTKYRVLFVDQIPRTMELKIGDLCDNNITGRLGKVDRDWVQDLSQRLQGPVQNAPGDTQMLLDALEMILEDE